MQNLCFLIAARRVELVERRDLWPPQLLERVDSYIIDLEDLS